MVDWCFIVVDSFNLSRETVGIAMSILDRYLISGKGKSTEGLQNKQTNQFATTTFFYMAVKIRACPAWHRHAHQVIAEG